MSTKKKKIIIFILVIILIVIITILSIGISHKNTHDESETKSLNCQVISKLELAVGDSVPSYQDFLINCDKTASIKYYLNGQEMSPTELTEPNKYDVKITIDKLELSSILIVKEKQNILLEVQDLTISYGEKYQVEDFVKKCESNMGECQFTFEDKSMEEYREVGKYEIVIVASVNEETISKKATLTIEEKEEESPPQENTTPSQENPNTNNNENSPKPEEPPTTGGNTVTKVQTVNEDVKSYSYKYGVTITTTTTITYDVYSDGSRKEVGRHDSVSYDYSTFNATTSDLLGEATSLASSSINTISSVVSYVNQYRSEVGAPSIVNDSSLNIAAMVRALEIGWSRKFDHTRPNGTSCTTVLDEIGIYPMGLGENIAYGYVDAPSVSEGWKNSPGHYQNMINASFTKIGVGFVNVNGSYYWVQIFTS